MILPDSGHERRPVFDFDCRKCRTLWIREVGGSRGVCMICDHRHWPWEPHGSGFYDPIVEDAPGSEL